jgi:hypothetical protein
MSDRELDNVKGLPRLNLFTAAGEWVGCTPTMPWTPGHEPEVVVWGARTFVIVRGTTWHEDGPPEPCYREVFAWHAPWPLLMVREPLVGWPKGAT